MGDVALGHSVQGLGEHGSAITTLMMITTHKDCGGNVVLTKQNFILTYLSNTVVSSLKIIFVMAPPQQKTK